MTHTSFNEELFARYFSGNASEEEQRTLLAWIHESRKNEQPPLKTTIKF